MAFIYRLLITHSFFQKINTKLITNTALTFLCRRRFINNTVTINEPEIIMNILNRSTVYIFQVFNVTFLGVITIKAEL